MARRNSDYQSVLVGTELGSSSLVRLQVELGSSVPCGTGINTPLPRPGGQLEHAGTWVSSACGVWLNDAWCAGPLDSSCLGAIGSQIVPGQPCPVASRIWCPWHGFCSV